MSITTQQELNDRVALNETFINTNVVIDDTGSLDPIVTLHWPTLQAVNGYLQITLQVKTHLDDAFPNLLAVNGAVSINNCSELIEISESAFPLFTSLSLNVTNNNKLEAIKGFQSLHIAQDFEIQANPALVDISGFCNLYGVRGIFNFGVNTALTNVDAFCNLNFFDQTSFNYFEVFSNTSLVQFCGLAPLANQIINFYSTEVAINSHLNVSNNGIVINVREIAELECAAPTWDFLPPHSVLLQCGDDRSIINPVETGVPTANNAKSVTFVDATEQVSCSTIVTRTWTALNFCNVAAEPFVQVITDRRECPIALICPQDFHASCTDTNLFPSTTGEASVVGALAGAYTLIYSDTVAKRNKQTCKPTVIKRKWTLKSNCPLQSSVQQCVQTIYVPKGWPHFSASGYVPGLLCNV